ncbi:nuclear RNA-splicing-associated protein-domain-containing protein [Fennellomyces sp. T-0311]|nr:nuclear RNA-splicing-associated protein-domain-containing protein [Fennellomyces sp. T-0311]
MKEKRSKKKKHEKHSKHVKGVKKDKQDDTLDKLRQLAREHNKKEQVNQARKPSEETRRRQAAMVPQSKESYDKQRSIIRREYDRQTGRTRLIKGSGEILETVVSRDQHRQINQRATVYDGISFQAHLQK